MKSAGSREIYKFYKQKCKIKKLKPVSSSVCKHLWEDMNLEIKRIILEESDEFKLPYRLGRLRVRKRILDYSLIPANKFKIDYGQTRKTGVTCYYTNDNVYKIHWDKSTAYATHITLYFFKACRALNRELSKYIKQQGKDYFE